MKLRFQKIFMVLLTLIVGLSIAPMHFAEASSDYVTATKSVNPSEILVGGETEVTLNIKGTPPVNVVKPNDVILIIDRSGSMGTEKMDSAKSAAKGFIDLMDLSKHRVGIVDYSDTAASFDLTSDAQSAKAYIDTLRAGGGTSTGAAIEKSKELLSNHREEAQPVIVLMTDGQATGTGDGLNAFDYTLKKASEAKDAGIVFYTIALLNTNEDPITSAPNVLLKNMATTSHHHHFVLGSVGLSEIYAAIVQEIGLASAYDVVVTENVNDNFEIVAGSYEHNIPKPTVNGNTLTWNFLELKNDTLSFSYKVRHKLASKAGTFPATKSTSVITYKDYSGANRTYFIPSQYIKVKYPAPIITSVTPDKGKVSGGEEITIIGENFLPNPQVSFGGYTSSSVTFVSDKELKVITPQGAQGQVKLSVINTDGQAAAANFNYYVDPEVSQISPNTGSVAGGTLVMINGKYFLPGVKVKFGENYSPTVTRYSSIYLNAVTPAGTDPVSVDVTIENPDGTLVTVPNAFTYTPLPTVKLTSISPSTGYTTGGETVTLNGEMFKKDSKVFFGDVEATGLVYYSPTKLTVMSPAWLQEEAVDVKVVNTDGTSSELLQVYQYVSPPPPPAPSITSVSPNHGPLAGGTPVYIDGKNFVAGAKVIWGTDREPQVTFVNNTRLLITSPGWSTSETVDITVINPDQQSTLYEDAFTYDEPPKLPAPKIKAITPANGPLKGNTTIYVDGSGYNSSTKMYFVTSGGEVDLGATYVNSTRIMAVTPASSLPGPVDVKVVNADLQSSTLPSGFSYDPPPVYPDPVITGINPSVGSTRGGYLIDINGTGFQKNAIVIFGDKQLTLTAYLNSTNVRVTVPASNTTGSIDVTIINPDGKSHTMVGAFTYQEDIPTIKLLSPNSGPMAGGTVVYVDGSYFVKDVTASLNNVSVPVTYVNASRIMFTTPASSVSGTVEFKITNPSGLSAVSSFTYNAPPPALPPVVTTVSPAYGPLSGGTFIYIDGSNLKSGAKINFNGVLYDTTYVNSRRVMFQTPAGTSKGIVTFTIINPDGQESGTLNFEYK
ncbi:IPT/TIG domain-containing protein [Paenibacillus sp. MDMC362]|uniref:IPT/TIG domain-containing protein n=1 Tax=Paenibacillus sp. MDMC362 TaxID=2977365 RepID=UPI000DC56CFD|nr:IPT/TIG domain-containing protein [Paenibacillus sp. MDMC362]RAR42445.1 VWA domain-containing protein [Paenibacillus sp. MDMC362]